MNALRQHCIDRACAEPLDVLVVGGGINGAVSAAALAARGAKVALVDQGDFASCTSQSSSNLAWGGIKYMETFEFGLVRELCRSRNRLMEAYPRQVQEIRFFTSIAKGFRKPRWMVFLGALLYWLIGACRTRPPRLLSRAAIRREAPMVRSDVLAGGIEYSDCLLPENDARFVFGFVRRALDRGGMAINYCELAAAERRDGLWHCALRDRAGGGSLSIRARCIVNAAGPLADALNAKLGIASPYRHLLSKGVHIVVPRIGPASRVLAFFASDGRLFFMIPMGNRTSIGTTDTRVDDAAAGPTEEDIGFLLDNANALLALDNPLALTDVVAVRCGVRPLVVRRDRAVEDADWMALSRRHVIDRHPAEAACAIYGGKLTDCLNVGDEVAGAIRSFGVALREPDGPWYGEEPAGEEPEEPPLIGACTRTRLRRMAEGEMVVHLEDFLRRRTLLALVLDHDALRTHPGLPEAARILFGERAEEELRRYFARDAEPWAGHPPLDKDGSMC